MEAKEIFQKYKELEEKYYNNIIEEEEYNELLEQIVDEIDKLLEGVDGDALIELSDDDIEGMSNYEPTYKGQKSFIEDSDGVLCEDELIDFLFNHASDNDVRKIAVVTGAKYRYQYCPDTDDDMVRERDFAIYYFK